MIIGKNVGVMYGGETSYGSVATATTSIGIVDSFSPTWTKNTIPIYGVGGGRNFTTAVNVAVDYKWSLTTNFSDTSFLRHAIGPLTGLS